MYITRKPHGLFFIRAALCYALLAILLRACALIKITDPKHKVIEFQTHFDIFNYLGLFFRHKTGNMK